MPSSTVFERRESAVRAYCRNWPTTFDQAQGSRIRDTDGRTYLDFFTGVATLAYGHNPEPMKSALIDYLQRDGVIHGLDTHTWAKQAFLESFEARVLVPRDLDYRVMFTGPTGTNAAEAALKIARRVTGRHGIVSFTNSFHGLSLGALPFTSNPLKRAAAGVPLYGATTVPYDGYMDPADAGLTFLDAALSDVGSGIDKPAAVIVEAVQGEGGLTAASPTWLRELERICRKHDLLLILDDIMMGVGRTGRYFSFEEAGITPDIVLLSKALSGYGLPLALTLVRPEYDVLEPGAHSGTFRGNNAAFVTAASALETYWADDALLQHVVKTTALLRSGLEDLARSEDGSLLEPYLKGAGLATGLHLGAEFASRVCAKAFENGLIIEACGPRKETIMFLPALTATDSEIKEGLDIVAHSLGCVVDEGLQVAPHFGVSHSNGSLKR